MDKMMDKFLKDVKSEFKGVEIDLEEEEEKVVVPIQEPEVTRKGGMIFKFTEKMLVPFDFGDLSRRLDETEEEASQRRALQIKMRYDQIDVARDILDFTFVMKSDVDPRALKFYVSLEEWTEDKFNVSLKFEDPMLISQGQERDTVFIKVKNKNYFISQETGLPIDTSNLLIKQTLPRQLPPGVDENDLIKNAELAAQALEGLVYVQIAMQIFLKGGLEDLLQGFYCI